jgi:hypothetical protein
MASSHRRKKQNRAKAVAKHAEARRRRATTARIHAVQARLSRIYHPETSAAELAILLGEHYQGVPVAGWPASALLREGSSLARLQDAAKLMLSSQDVPSLTALTFAAAVAGAAGDAEEERRLIDQALAADEAGDPDVRLEVIDFISTSGHAAEAVELLEPRLKEAPDDDFAGDLYGAAIERAYATAAQMKPPPGNAPRCTGSPTARAWSRSGTPSAPSWTAPNSARRSGGGRLRSCR